MEEDQPAEPEPLGAEAPAPTHNEAVDTVRDEEDGDGGGARLQGIGTPEWRGKCHASPQARASTCRPTWPSAGTNGMGIQCSTTNTETAQPELCRHPSEPTQRSVEEEEEPEAEVEPAEATGVKGNTSERKRKAESHMEDVPNEDKESKRTERRKTAWNKTRARVSSLTWTIG